MFIAIYHMKIEKSNKVPPTKKKWYLNSIITLPIEIIKVFKKNWTSEIQKQLQIYDISYIVEEEDKEKQLYIKNCIDVAQKLWITKEEMTAIKMYWSVHFKAIASNSRKSKIVKSKLKQETIQSITELMVSWVSKLPSAPTWTYRRWTALPRNICEDILKHEKNKKLYKFRGIYSVSGIEKRAELSSKWFTDDSTIETMFIFNAPIWSEIRHLSLIDPKWRYTDLSEQILLNGSWIIKKSYIKNWCLFVEVDLLENKVKLRQS